MSLSCFLFSSKTLFLEDSELSFKLYLEAMSYENVRKSKIMEHIPHHRSDNLYNPLRNALNKSVSPTAARERRASVTPAKVESSRITHDIRMLSTIEADKIVINC